MTANRLARPLLPTREYPAQRACLACRTGSSLMSPFRFRKQQSALELASQDLVFCRHILIPQQEFLIDRSGEATTRAQCILDSP
jgi:hypothetical protein